MSAGPDSLAASGSAGSRRAPPASARRPGALRAVRRADRRPSTATCSTCRDARAAVRLPGVLDPVRPRGGRRRPLPARARPPPAARRLRARRRACGRSCGCRSTWRSSSATRAAGRVHRVLPEPDGPDGVAARARRVGGARGGQPGAGRRSSPTSRRCWSTARAARGSTGSCPIDDCYALVGLIRTRWRGLTGGTRGVGGDRRVLRGARPARPAGEPTTTGEEMTMAKLRLGKPDEARTRPAHVTGHQAGQLDGQLREAGRATCPTAARPPRRSTGINPTSASRSTRGCRTCSPA